MSTYGSIFDASTAVVDYVQSADPVDLQTRANALLASLPPTEVITELSLAGAGDGHTFVLLIEHAPFTTTDEPPLPNASGGLDPGTTTIGAYMASQSEALDAARAAVPFLVGQSVEDEMVAGAAKGTRFMGVVVKGFARVTPATLVASGELSYGPEAVAAPGAVLLNSTLVAAAFFDMPVGGQLTYLGIRPIIALIDLSISLQLAGPGFGGQVEAVQDPLGTPIPIAPPLLFPGTAALTASVHTTRGLQTFPPGNPSVGIRLSGLASDATVVSAMLRVVQFNP